MSFPGAPGKCQTAQERGNGAAEMEMSHFLRCQGVNLEMSVIQVMGTGSIKRFLADISGVRLGFLLQEKLSFDTVECAEMAIGE